MLDDISHEHFEDWVYVFQADPWGEERADMRMARQVWASLQPHAKRKLNERNYRLTFRRRSEPPPTPEEYRRKAMRAYLANGGRIVKAS